MVSTFLWLALIGVATTVSEAKLRPAKPQDLGFVTIPITHQHRPENSGIHPQIRHAQHVNRALKRRALMQGNSEPSASLLLGNIVRSIETLPAQHRKRFDLDIIGDVGDVVAGIIKGAVEVTGETVGTVFHALGFRPHGYHSSASAHHHTTPKGPAGNSAAQGGYSPIKADANNNNTLTKAIEATFKDSTGLDIEANDLGYIAEMKIGTPARLFKLLVDSGSADFWIGGEGCKSDTGSCGPHTFLGPKSSSSFVDTGKKWSILYGSGSTDGHIVKDNVAVAGLSLKAHKFGIAKNESSQFSSEGVPFDGILGLAKTSLSQQQTPTLVEALHSEGLISAAITSYKLSRVSDEKDDGAITFGGMDPSKFDADALVVLPNINTAGFFEAQVDAIHIDGKSLGFVNKTAILDTGTSLILAPDADAKKIHAHIPGAKYSKELYSYTLPCNSTVKLQLQFGGRAFTIQSSDLTYLPVDPANLNGQCLSGIVPGSIGDDNTWLCGDVFLKNVYFSTDADKDTITLADLA